MKSITLENDRISVRFPYAEGLVRRVREIPNIKWDNENTCWFMPASKMYAQYAQTLANEHQFSMDNGVYQLLRRDMAQQRDHLYPYQRAAVDFAHANNGSCLIADDMGLGKTVEALTYALESDAQSVLIVCPASVLYNWQDEVTKWTGWDSQVVLTGKLPINGARVLIMSYAIMLRRIYELTEREFSLVIFDESTHINSMKAKTSLAADQLISKAKLFLSGTPFMNRPIELFHVLHMIDPFSYKSYWAYANKYAGASQQTIWTAGGRRTFWDVSGATNLDELKQRIAPIVIRRTKSEVMKDLPELTRTKIEVDISNKSEYVSALLDFKRYLKEHGKPIFPIPTEDKILVSGFRAGKMNANNALTKLNYLRQIVGQGKIASAVELAEEALSDPDRKVVVYAHHKDMVSKLKEKLADYGVDTIIGDDSNIKRADTVKKFQEQTLPRVLVISDAGGEGVNLFRADVIIIAELPWHDSSLEQLEGRLHRNGQKNAVTSYVLVGRKTIDTHIYELIYNKRDVKGELFSMNEVIEIIEKGE